MNGNGVPVRSRPTRTLAMYRKWCAQPFPPIFWICTISDRNFAKIVAPPSDENENYVVHLKEQSLLKKRQITTPKSGNKRQRNACSNYAPLERTVLRTRSVTNKQTKTHHIFARRPTAYAFNIVRSSPNCAW